MSEQSTPDYGVVEDATLTIQRLLPGPIERVWAYLTDSDLRRKWLAAGEMELKVGAPFEFVWRNDELTDPPGNRPDGFSDEHRMASELTELDPPHKLSFTWGETGGVTFQLEPKGEEVLLTVIHRRVTEHATLLGVSAGWHVHLDILSARLWEEDPGPFWDRWRRLRQDYETRLPA
ncbi:MAG: SRPBCC family protein [Methyloligella sp. ZOD6]